jgi:hypothetical protein
MSLFWVRTPVPPLLPLLPLLLPAKKSVNTAPQANSLLDSNGNVNTNLVVLGDMREMAGILDLVDFQYHPEKENQTQEW